MIWHLILEFILADVATICFGILMNIPHKAYLPGGIIGGTVWIFYILMYYHLHLGLAMSNLLAAIAISVLSLMAARRFRLPMIIFNVPALVSFVPGGQSYQVVRNFVLGNNGTAMSYLYQVIVIAGAITLGFGLGDVINAALHYRPKKWKNR
ncbi:threonine/serine exporter family protein [uncultured Limosilactobacillus sp.]|uniref:threonine/serine exporter family protein n=1 Tax=uncultured Limosilactobacillus sp. TaxID=2837629 RepID=UPI0025DEEB68|nr:threonine/serine exporter family protein [uncultured Limosilactobacillus sp.]